MSPKVSAGLIIYAENRGISVSEERKRETAIVLALPIACC